MIFPAWTLGNILLYAYFVLLVLAIAPLELRGLSMMNYSKFRPAQGWPGRTGMVILYALPLVVLVAAAVPYLPKATPIQWLVFGAVAVHFIKRVLESLFVHRYSGPIGIFTTLLIAGFYSLAAFLIGYLNRTPLPSVDGWFMLGCVLFVVGALGNFYHHKLLADLRRDTLAYAIPHGGLFQWVACPHYLFEIIIWLGIFLLSRHFAALLVLAFIIAYLSARAVRTLRWYREKFTDFPKERKAILPFIF